MSSGPETLRRPGDATTNRFSRAADALAAGAAQPAWLDGWAAVWGMALAQPDLTIGGTWSRVAAVGVIVWLLTWARDLEDPARRHGTTTIPGGRGALAVAALAVAAVLGTGPLIVFAAWLAVGVRRFRPEARWGAVSLQLRLWMGALGAWLALNGVAAARGARFAEPGTLAPYGALQVNGFDVALILAGCALAVGATGTDDARTRAARPWSGAVYVAGFVVLASGLIVADRPGGLWLAALCAAALWPGRSESAWNGPILPARSWLPFALGAVCIVDRLIP
ncbi:MAG: hypothetical protein IPG72_07515 [Ardenticatenales bacterium]|nr:hypothetical protein [Ardenticatenales bacterium]